MYQSLSDLVDLTRARLRDLPFREPRASAFDVASAHDPAARARLAALLADHASLAGQTHALSRDRWQLLFTEGRRAALPFHDRRFTLVAFRDPIGPDQERDHTLALFRRYAAHRGKHAIVLAASGEARDAGDRLGFSTTWLGREQVFDLRRFHTRGRAGAKLRLAINHARRSGLVAREIAPRTDPVVRADLDALEAIWKRARPERRTRSFLRTEPMENAFMRRYFAVESRDSGRMESFLVCAPVSRRGWYLQDLVRHPDAPRGAAELASLFALETFAAEGLERATMGIVPFFDPDGEHARESRDETRPASGGSAIDGVAGRVVRTFDALFHFSGLQQFRAKFPATRLVDVHALIWPRVLTPLVGWDLLQTLT